MGLERKAWSVLKRLKTLTNKRSKYIEQGSFLVCKSTAMTNINGAADWTQRCISRQQCLILLCIICHNEVCKCQYVIVNTLLWLELNFLLMDDVCAILPLSLSCTLFNLVYLLIAIKFFVPNIIFANIVCRFVENYYRLY